ncbi:MAG: YhcN/YlaJ family sporulation lipoprotein [Clostridia bacterium]|nr:YhcN/YlaJ family sporulation lipoprotein [Clostridia bacterium]
MKKWMMALLCMVAASMVMTGCAANANGLGTTAAPVATNSPMMTESPAMSPEATTLASPSPAMSDEPAAGAAASAMTPAQAGRLAEQVADAVERISEISDAEVIVHNERVLVAVEFDDQYSAGLDDRMKQLITETVQQVDSSLTDVEITDDSTLYGQVKGLGERVAKVTGLDELADDFGDLWDRITGR